MPTLARNGKKQKKKKNKKGAKSEKSDIKYYNTIHFHFSHFAIVFTYFTISVQPALGNFTITYAGT